MVSICKCVKASGERCIYKSKVGSDFCGIHKNCKTHVKSSPKHPAKEFIKTFNDGYELYLPVNGELFEVTRGKKIGIVSIKMGIPKKADPQNDAEYIQVDLKYEDEPIPHKYFRANRRLTQKIREEFLRIGIPQKLATKINDDREGDFIDFVAGDEVVAWIREIAEKMV